MVWRESRLTRHHNLLTGSPPLTGPIIKKGGGRTVGKKIGRKVSAAGITLVGITESDPTSIASPTISLTSLTGGSGSAPQAGDTVVICINQIVSSTTTSAASIAGYTPQVDVLGADASGIKARFHVFTKRLTAADTEVVLVTDQPPAVTIHVLRGINATTLLDVATVTAIGDNTGQPNPPPITPATTGALIFACGGGGWNTVVPFTSSDLTGFVSSENGRTSFRPNTGAGFFAWESGAFDPAQFGGGNTSTNAAWGAATMAFRPA